MPPSAYSWKKPGVYFNPDFVLAKLLLGQTKRMPRLRRACGVNLVPAGQPKAILHFTFLCMTDRRTRGCNAKFGFKVISEVNYLNPMKKRLVFIIIKHITYCGIFICETCLMKSVDI